jgi:hypothetical protein
MVPTSEQLIDACNCFFTALSNNTPPLALLHHFSTTHPVSIQHCPARCPHPHASILRGPNAVRSYFDILATHWTRSNLTSHAVSADPMTRRVVVTGSVIWTWKRSGRSWQEDFTCTLAFDDSDALKITNFIVLTESGPGTCVLRAIDPDPDVGAHVIKVAVCFYSSLSYSSADTLDLSDVITPISWHVELGLGLFSSDMSPR